MQMKLRQGMINFKASAGPAMLLQKKIKENAKDIFTNLKGIINQRLWE